MAPPCPSQIRRQYLSDDGIVTLRSRGGRIVHGRLVVGDDVASRLAADGRMLRRVCDGRGRRHRQNERARRGDGQR